MILLHLWNTLFEDSSNNMTIMCFIGMIRIRAFGLDRFKMSAMLSMKLHRCMTHLLVIHFMHNTSTTLYIQTILTWP